MSNVFKNEGKANSRGSGNRYFRDVAGIRVEIVSTTNEKFSLLRIFSNRIRGRFLIESGEESLKVDGTDSKSVDSGAPYTSRPSLTSSIIFDIELFILSRTVNSIRTSLARALCNIRFCFKI